MKSELHLSLATERSTDCSRYSVADHRHSARLSKEICDVHSISLGNLPKSLKIQLFVFKLLHFSLFLIAISMIIKKRMDELRDIKSIEKLENAHMQDLFYMITGLVYVKNNIEIINFVCYCTLLTDLQKKGSLIFWFKVGSEIFIMLLSFVKICVYIFELFTHAGLTGRISCFNIMGETMLIGIHMTILCMYVTISSKFSNSRMLRKIFRVYYLNKDIRVR